MLNSFGSVLDRVMPNMLFKVGDKVRHCKTGQEAVIEEIRESGFLVIAWQMEHCGALHTIRDAVYYQLIDHSA